MEQTLPLFQKTFNLIQGAERILLLADLAPDGDSIGSSSAFFNWLTREGKDVTIFCQEPIPQTLHFLDNIHLFTSDPCVFEQQHDLVITFDASDRRRAGLADHGHKLRVDHTLVVFDHHATNERFGHINVVLTEACSTAEVVYRFFEQHHITIDEKMATALLVGILYDTSFFSNSGTTNKGLEAAGQLVARGARYTHAIQHMLKNKSVPALRLWGLALSRLTHRPKLDLAFTYFLHQDLKDVPRYEEAVAGVSNFLNGTVAGVDAVLVLTEMPDQHIRGSLRSLNRDVSKLAKFLGGGGHKKAAGFTVKGKLNSENGKIKIIS